MIFITWVLSKIAKLILGKRAEVFYYPGKDHNKWLIVSETYKNGFIGNRPWGEGRTLTGALRDTWCSYQRFQYRRIK